MARLLRRFYPHRRLRSVAEIDPADLAAAGVEAIVIDLDNTLVAWGGEEISQEVVDWLAAVRKAGIQLCIASNTHRPRRLARLSERLGIPYVERTGKPRRRGFLAAMQRMGSRPETTCVVGDQVFTDIWGGNRCGLHTILVEPIGRREFIGTKVSRLAERVVLAFYRRQNP